MSKDKNWLNLSRNWLKKNQVFFNTVAASLISIMAIIVSVLQIRTSEDQNEILRNQTTIIGKQSILMSIQTDYAKDQLKQSKLQTNLNELQYDNAKKFERLQLEISKKQNTLLEEQTSVALKQHKTKEIEDIVTRRNNWVVLNDTIHEIWWEHPPFKKLSVAEKIEYFERQLKRLLPRQINSA